MKAFSPQMIRIARLFLANEQGGPLAQMRITSMLSPECKSLGALVVHANSVFSSKAELDILLPLVNMMTNPAALAVSNHTIHKMTFVLESA